MSKKRRRINLLQIALGVLTVVVVAGCAPSTDLPPTATQTPASDERTSPMAFGEIVSNAVPVRRGPGDEHDLVGSLGQGETVAILSKEGDWYKALSPQFDHAVWVFARFVREQGAARADEPAAPKVVAPAGEGQPAQQSVPAATNTPPPTPTSVPAQPATSTPVPTATPTSVPTQTPTSTPLPTATPVPGPAVPVLADPPAGGEFKNPIVFRWQGSLNAGERYQVTVYHPASNERVQTGPLTDREWSYELPANRTGEWRWTVWVVRQGTVVTTSEEWMFWFDPWKGRDLAPSSPKAPGAPPSLPELPTPTPPPTPGPWG